MRVSTTFFWYYSINPL